MEGKKKDMKKWGWAQTTEIEAFKAWQQVDEGQTETKKKVKYWKEIKVLQNGVSVKTNGKGKACIGCTKNLVGACNLATANDKWMLTIRRWEECVLWLWGCSESVCMGAVRKCKIGLEISQVMNLECCRQRGWMWGRERNREGEQDCTCVA